MKGLFLVTGTDTEVGKTRFTLLLIESLRRRGENPFAIKPFETGCGEGMVPPDADAYLSALKAGDPGLSLEDICYYRYREPVSPNIAARLSGRSPDMGVVKKRILNRLKERGLVFVEGAGGIMVEAVDGVTFLDMAVELSMKVIIVAPNRLGVLNQVALTLSALKIGGANLAGITLNDLSPPLGAAPAYNYQELSRKYGDKILGRVPFGATCLPDDIITKLRDFKER